MRTRLLLLVLSMLLFVLLNGCTYRTANFQVVNVSGSDSCSATGECLLKFTVVDGKGKPLTGYSLTDAQWYKVFIDFGDGTRYNNYLDKCITSGYCQILPNNFMGFKHTYTKNGNFVVVLDIHDIYYKGVYDKLPIFININPCLGRNNTCDPANGTCIPESATDYRCMCKQGFVNSYLDDHLCVVDPCLRSDRSRMNCSDKGICAVDENNGPVCICRDGFRSVVRDDGARDGGSPEPTCEATNCSNGVEGEESVEIEGGYVKRVIRPFEINVTMREDKSILVDFSPTDVRPGCVKDPELDPANEALETTANMRNLMKKEAYVLAGSNCNYPAKDTFTPLFDYYMDLKDSPIEPLCYSDHALLKERRKKVTEFPITGCADYIYKKYFHWNMWQDIAAETYNEPFKTVQFSATPIISVGYEPDPNDRPEVVRAYGGRILYWGDKMLQGQSVGMILSPFRFSDAANIQPLNPFVVVQNKLQGRNKRTAWEQYYYPETWSSYLESYKTAREWIDDARSSYSQWDDFFAEKGEDALFDNYRLIREGLLDLLSTAVILRDFKNGLKETGIGKKPGYWLKAILAFRQRTGTWPKEIQYALSDPAEDIEAAMARPQLHDAEEWLIDDNGDPCENCSNVLTYETADNEEPFVFRDSSGRLMRYFPDNVIVEMWDILSEKEQAVVLARISGGIENIINHSNSDPSENYTGPRETTAQDRKDMESALFEQLNQTGTTGTYLGKTLHNALSDLLDKAMAAADVAGCLLSINEAAGNPMFQKQLELCRWLPEVFVEKVRADLNGKQYNTLSQDCRAAFPVFGDMLYTGKIQECEKNGKPYENKTIIEMMQYDFSRCNSNLPECEEEDGDDCSPLEKLERFDEFKCYGDKPELYDISYQCRYEVYECTLFPYSGCSNNEFSKYSDLVESSNLGYVPPYSLITSETMPREFVVTFKNVAYHHSGDFPNAQNGFYFSPETLMEQDDSGLKSYADDGGFIDEATLQQYITDKQSFFPSDTPDQLPMFLVDAKDSLLFVNRSIFNYERAHFVICEDPKMEKADAEKFFCVDRAERKVSIIDEIDIDANEQTNEETKGKIKGSCKVWATDQYGQRVLDTNKNTVSKALNIQATYSLSEVPSAYEWSDGRIKTELEKALQAAEKSEAPDQYGYWHLTCKYVCNGYCMDHYEYPDGEPITICDSECFDVDIPYMRTVTPVPDYANYFDEASGNLLGDSDFGQNGAGFYGRYTSDVVHFDQYLKRAEEYRKYRMSLLSMKFASSNMGGHAGFYNDEDSGKKGFNTYEYDVYKLGNDLFNVHMGYAYGYGIEGFEVIEEYIKQVQEEGKNWDVDTLMNLTRLLDGFDFKAGENKNIFSAVLTDICKRKYGELFDSETPGSKEKCLGMLQYCEKSETGSVDCHGMEGYADAAYNYLEYGERYYFDECVSDNTIACYKKRGVAFPCKEGLSLEECLVAMGNFSLTPYLYGYFGAGATIFGYPLSMNAVNNIQEDITGVISDLVAQQLQDIVDKATKPIRKGIDAGCADLINTINGISYDDTNISIPQISFGNFDIPYNDGDMTQKVNGFVEEIEKISDTLDLLKQIQTSSSAQSFANMLSSNAADKVESAADRTAELMQYLVSLVVAELSKGGCSLTDEQVNELLTQIQTAGNLEKKLEAVQHDFVLIAEDMDEKYTNNADLKKKRLFEASKKALANYIGALRTVFKEQIDRIGGSGGLISQIIKGQLENIIDNPGVFAGTYLGYAGGHPDEAFEIMAYLKLNSQGTIQAPSNSSGMEGIDDFHQELRETQRLYRMHIYRLGQYIYNSEDDYGKENSAARTLAQFDLQKIKDLTPDLDASYSGSCEGIDSSTDAYKICLVLAAKDFVSTLLAADDPESAVKALLEKEGKENLETLKTIFGGNELKVKAIVTDMIRELDRSKKEITAALKNFEKKIVAQYPTLNPDSAAWKEYTKKGKKELLRSKLVPIVTRQILSVADGTQEFNTESSGDLARYAWSFKTVLGEYDFGIVQVKLTAGVFLDYSAKYSVSMGVIENNALIEFDVDKDRPGEIRTTSAPFGLAAGFNARIDNPLKIWANAEGTASISAWGIVNAHGTLGVDIDVLYINVPFVAGAKLSFDTAKMVPYIDFDAYLAAQLDILPHSEVYFKASVDILGIDIINTGRMTLFEDFLPSYSYTYTIFEMPEDYQRIYLDDIIHLF